MTTSPRTFAEAQAILDFVQRALDDANKHGGSLGYSIQIELDTLAKETGVTQPFECLLPTMADEHMAYAVVDGQMEVVEL